VCLMVQGTKKAVEKTAEKAVPAAHTHASLRNKEKIKQKKLILQLHHLFSPLLFNLLRFLLKLLQTKHMIQQ